ncbi:MAG: DUF6512 family protein [Candidatus Thorarchaeota archaeon]
MSTKVEAVESEIGDLTKKKLIIWEVIGWVVIFGFGSLFHFWYEWLPWKPYGWFFAINESMWEHSKLSFWPALIFYLIQYFVLRKKNKNLAVAGALSLAVGIIFMQSFYYTIVGAFGQETRSLTLSLSIFILAVLAQQFTHYLIISINIDLDQKRQLTIDIISLVYIVMLIVIVILFTYIQPELPIFYDDLNGIYGFLPTS